MSTPATEVRPLVGSPEKPSLIMKLASKYNIVPEKLMETLKATCFKSKEPATNEQMVALLVVADQYNLNPFTKEIYAYPDKYKGIVPVVSIDGWIKIINEHPQYNGFELYESETVIESEGGEHAACFAWCGIRYFRKGIEHTPMIKEYFDECYQEPGTTREGVKFNGPWQTHTKRMLRWKTMIQGARAIFGFAGIYDEDEATRIAQAQEQPQSTGITIEAGSNRTNAATDALRNKLGITNQSGTGALDMTLKDLGNLESSRVAVKTKDAEWDPPAAQTLEREPLYTEASAIEFLRMQKKSSDLKNAWAMVYEDYKGRDLPIEIEAIYGDRLELLLEQGK